MTSAKAAATLQEDEWRRLVWQWIGMPSSMNPTAVTASGPMLPGVNVTSRTWLSVTNQRSGDRACGTFTCATFEMKTSFDPEALAAVVDSLQKDSPFVLPSVTPLELEEVIRVTMETGTMLPHEILVTRMTRMRMDVSGETLTNRDAYSRRSIFVHDVEPDAPASNLPS